MKSECINLAFTELLVSFKLKAEPGNYVALI